MKVFAISDLHLPGRDDKPMNVFGSNWDNYTEKIREDWLKKVNEDDIVILAGDLSWAMEMKNVVDDIEYINSLPGKKVILRGNHDYWWQSIANVREMLPENIYAVQNDAIKLGKVVICGSRGWTCPNKNNFTEHDEKIYRREGERLKLSIATMKKLYKEGDEVIGIMHYPPFNVKREASIFTEIFESVGIKKVIYGHLHGKDSLAVKKFSRANITYYLTSCDLVDFKLQLISEIE